MILQWLRDNPEYWILIAIVASFALLLVRQTLLNRAAEYIATATVLSRRLGTANFHSKYSSGYNHLVTFRLGGSDTLELYVSREEYAQLTEGLRGTLRWQDENFLSFETED